MVSQTLRLSHAKSEVDLRILFTLDPLKKEIVESRLWPDLWVIAGL